VEINEAGTFVELDAAKTYTVATNAFTAKGGDEFKTLEKAYAEGRVTDLGLSDWENFRDHLVSIGEVTPKVEGRVVDTKTP
jgi:2',3'-cyclic-nucleotide 2'-phosphodiesterase (5'-nucleotidase family)